MKKNLFKVLVGLFALASAVSQTFEGKGAKTAEEAVSNYLNALKSADYNQIIGCYAVETYAKNYDLEKYFKKMNCITLTMSIIYPQNPLLAQTGKFEVLSAINKMVKYQIWNLSGLGFFKKYEVIAPIEQESAFQEALSKALPKNPEKRLSSIVFGEFIPQEKVLSHYTSNDDEELAEFLQRQKEYQEKTKKIYGCKDIKDVTASFFVKGKKYYYFAETIKFGNKWYISPNQGWLACIAGINISNGCIADYRDLEWTVADEDEENGAFVIKRENGKVSAKQGVNSISGFSKIDRTDPTQVLAAFFESYLKQTGSWKDFVSECELFDSKADLIEIMQDAFRKFYGVAEMISITFNEEDFDSHSGYYTIKIAYSHKGEEDEGEDQVAMAQNKNGEWFVMEVPR